MIIDDIYNGIGDGLDNIYNALGSIFNFDKQILGDTLSLEDAGKYASENHEEFSRAVKEKVEGVKGYNEMNNTQKYDVIYDAVEELYDDFNDDIRVIQEVIGLGTFKQALRGGYVNIIEEKAPKSEDKKQYVAPTGITPKNYAKISG